MYSNLSFIKIISLTIHVCTYLEGATPTILGPSPLNRERGPSFCKIILENKKVTIL